jgi:hypothetical protein
LPAHAGEGRRNPATGKAKEVFQVIVSITARGPRIALALIFAALSASRVIAQDGVRQGAQAQTQSQAQPVTLAPHRAIYDLSLGTTRGNSQIVGVSGRILYDFDGNACDGYTLQFRQVSELDSGEGKKATSDLRSTTWEDASAKSFKFNSQNFLNENLVDSVDGRAERGAGATAVNLVKPAHKAIDVGASVVFPTEHMVRVINAARAGATILDFPVYDGSDTGDKVFDTLTVIGHKLNADERKHDDAAEEPANQKKLADVARWPVTISYFDQNTAPKSGEQTPVYAIGFELYENGISRTLSLDYNDFVVSGKLTLLEFKDVKPCH